MPIVNLSVFAESGNTPSTLFEKKCAGCHALPDPQSLNANQWRVVLNTMQRRMREAGKVELTPDELVKLHCYLSGSVESTCTKTE